MGVAPASCRWYEQTFIGFHLGRAVTAQATVSVVSRSDGPGGKTYVPRDRYSLTMSFWVVPRSSLEATPWRSALATYRPNSHAAVALIVIEVFISVSGIWSNSLRISPRCGTGTPTLPTSPRESVLSGS